MNAWIVFGIIAVVVILDFAAAVWIGKSLAKMNPTDDWGRPL